MWLEVFFVGGGVRRQREQELSPWFSHPLGAFTAIAARPRSTDRLINPSMRCSTWRGNDLTKLNRQVQLWVCPRFEPPTPHLCISYTGRMPVYLLSFIPSASWRSNSFTILSPSPLLVVETPPSRSRQPQTDPEYLLKLARQLLALQDALPNPSWFRCSFVFDRFQICFFIHKYVQYKLLPPL